MDNQTLKFGILILLAVFVTATIGLFLFPYQPTQPPRADDSGSTQHGIQEVVTANNKFTFDLYKELIKTEEENIFYSPYSISAALGITYEGAKGETAEEIKSVFHFPERDILRPNFAAIYNEINKGGVEYTARTGNALWVQQDFPLLETYVDNVETYYGAKAANLDFVGETEKSRQIINSFIEKQTNNRIKDLIPEGVLGRFTRVIITNAIYFKGDWLIEFDESDTKDRDFYITPDNPIQVPMMYMKPEEDRFNYSETEDLQILELPYKGEEISMLVLLPKENLNSIEEKLTAENIESWKKDMNEVDLNAIYLPKFEFETKYDDLKNTLFELGMPTAFSGAADFSGFTGQKDLYISNVIHQAFVSVDEKGTEAAAATAVVMRLTAAPIKPTFRADKPFIFLIQQRDTGNILFLGRVIDPTQG